VSTRKAGAPTPEEAREELARILHDKMEHLDPSDEDSNWDRLTDFEKQFFRSCIERLAHEQHLLAALLCDETGNHGIARSEIR
jgi:hypothetical protein